MGRVPVTEGPTGSLRRIRFENQVGRATLAVTVDGVQMPDLPVEVVSAKLLPRGVGESLLTEHPLYYPNFFQALWQGIVGYLASLPFAFTAPTGFAVGELGRPPDDLFLLHFLKEENTRQRFAEALEAVRRNPHRQLRRRDELVPLAQASEVTSATVAAILPNAHWLVKADPVRVSVARRLRGPDGQSYAPLRVLQELPEETLDTPENRFVRWFLCETVA